ncbi:MULTISPECIES: M48 family metallopeptidase [unclassified Sphingopyxis]|jgi:outer membrane murein-binding lipoprotein Lpp|uniref:M48 family metallopeptidase n=1 Tax=unclassified Sphingopyxis TaxID=2614943 RepID=UPI0006C5E3DD|nr:MULTISPECIES: M48 family metallopeptidase [unclassified Sphingopyxis]USI77520.1 M48 family metallopeptidase [Sphingopyxis sp. USTB-05]GAO79992.1 trypsin-like serine proteases, typically periplasmic, contain C-terminal PDZ domain [Sphingopyxis sp. C-1]
MLRRARSIFLILSLSMAAPVFAAAPAEQSPYAALAATEARVAAIGFRLTVANAAWCPARQPQFGWIWGDPRLYAADRRSEALAAYGADDHNHAYIAALAPASPAASAGMTVGTPVTGIGSAPVPDGVGDHPFARITAIETSLAALPAGTPLTLHIGAGRIVSVTPVAGCISDFRVETSDRPAAVADGRMVLVNQGLADFASDDQELAAAIAHELAHNILHHRARLDAAGVDRGLGKQFGRNARLFRQTEVEADRLSVWLLAGAGYDPASAARFWTRFGQRKGRPLFQAGTHPPWRERVAALEAEAAAVAAARTAGQPLRPPLIGEPAPLE